MANVFHNPKLIRLVNVVKPWAIFISIFFLLKVTGVGSQISYVAQSTLLKAGVLDIKPATNPAAEEHFNYDFSVRDLEGNIIDVNDLKGKVIFLNLWATWCRPCRVEMPSIQRLYNSVDQHRIAFVILSLDQPGSQSKVGRFARNNGFTFPVYLPEGPLPRLLRVPTIPTTFIVGPDGMIKSRKAGLANYDTEEMRAFLNDLQAVE